VGFIGGIDAALFDTRLVFGAAVNVGATGMILFHNHPSGGLRPSPADEDMTSIFVRAGDVMEIKIVDHIILTASSYYSFRDERKIM
jgi:DNA repair protein RadC